MVGEGTYITLRNAIDKHEIDGGSAVAVAMNDHTWKLIQSHFKELGMPEMLNPDFTRKCSNIIFEPPLVFGRVVLLNETLKDEEFRFFEAPVSSR